MVSVGPSDRPELASSDAVVRAFGRYFALDELPPDSIATRGERDSITINALRAALRNDRAAFERSYADIRRRRISDEADWLFDNYLLFALAIGVRRFRADASFLRSALETRRQVQSGLEADVASDLLRLIDDVPSPADSPVTVVGFYTAECLRSDEKSLKRAYRAAAQLLADANTPEFMRIISRSTVDVIVASCPLIPSLPGRFWTRFNRRAAALAATLHMLVTVTLLALWAGLVIHYLTHESKVLDKLFSTGAIVFPGAILLGRKKIIGALTKAITRLVGGPDIVK